MTQYYPLDLNHWITETKKYLIETNDFYDDQDIRRIAMNEYMEYKESNIPTHTDKTGWDQLIDKITQTNSNLVFITARSVKMKEKL